MRRSPTLAFLDCPLLDTHHGNRLFKTHGTLNEFSDFKKSNLFSVGLLGLYIQSYAKNGFALVI